MTSESFNLDITNLTFKDLRPRTKRRHNRRNGWRPPSLINVNITTDSYDVIRSLALARGQKNNPFYDEVSQTLIEYSKVREELEEIREWLRLAVEDKKELRKEIERLSQTNLVISRNND